MEVTTHFWTPVMEEEKKELLEKIRVVVNLLAALKKVAGKGVWNISKKKSAPGIFGHAQCACARAMNLSVISGLPVAPFLPSASWSAS